jgi:C-terminal processing protease CtpA/Prc
MRPLFIIACLLLNHAVAAQKLFTAQQLQTDFVVLQKAYKTLHPGLYKYADSATIDRYFADCQRELNHDQSLADAYLTIMKLTARFKCGHSYPNFYNQEGEVKALFERPNTLPFWFRLVENRMLVTHSVDAAVPVGVEVVSINGVAVGKIIETMLPLVRADGSNDGKRLNLLQITGNNQEYFDVLLPLLFPNPKPAFVLKITDLRTKKSSVVAVNSVVHSARNVAIRQLNAAQKDSTATFRWLDDKTAVLTINSLASWDNSFRFGKFYERAVIEYNQKTGQNLVIDLRRCEGGDLWNGKQLIRHLISTPITINEQQDCWAYVSMDSSLSQYIDNQWAYQWRYRKADDFVRLPGGQYRGKKDGKGQQLDPSSNHLTGRVFLLTSATNSSAAWQLASVMREHRLATLVGQETGGNQKGITAGSLFFMMLPNTRIEVDVPLIGMDYAEAAKRPDAGIRPDVPVRPTVSAVLTGQDQELDAVRALLTRKN